MEARVHGPAIRLNDLPLEVLGNICRPLSLKDRVCLSITCRTLLHGLASSEDAWGMLEFASQRSSEKMLSILPWLARRRLGLQRLELGFRSAPKVDKSQATAQLAACLDGSPLVELKLYNMQFFGVEGGGVLQHLHTGLTNLEVVGCDLRCLPGVLKRLPALAKLSLSINKLGGASWRQLRQLTALTWLDISFCELSALPAELAALPTLAELSLVANKLGGSSWGLLQQLTALTRLNATYCGLAALPAELAALPALAVLDLRDNQELGAAAEEAWAPLAHCSGLSALNLGRIPFARLPPALAALAPHLASLSFKRIYDEGGLWAGGEATLGPLYRLTQLTRLNLSNCLWSFPLPEELSSLGALQDLNASFSDFSERLALRPLRHFTAVVRLNLSYCGLCDLPEEIAHMKALKELHLGNSSVRGTDISWQHLRGLTALTRLDLEMWDLKRLPPELAELRSLADLNLRLNGFLGGRGDGSAADFAAKWAALEQLTALTRLNASECKLHAVPAAFAALSKLQVLDLAGNPPLAVAGWRRSVC